MHSREVGWLARGAHCLRLGPRCLFVNLSTAPAEVNNSKGKIMAVRIEKDGWSVSGATLDELQIGIQAVQSALTRTDTSSLANAGKADRPKPAGRPRGSGGKTAEQRRKKQQKRQQLAVEFLRELKKHPAGVPSSQMAKKLDLHPKGIGNVFLTIESMAKAIPIPVEEIFVSEKKNSTDPSKTLTPKERIGEAITGLAKQLEL